MAIPKPRPQVPASGPDGTRWIALTKGLFALVDELDFERVSQHVWCALKTRKTAYAFFSKNRRPVYLHRFVMKAPVGVQVDHRDGNGLNCRRSNLRLATHAQNRRNSRKWKPASSRFKGVHWDSARGRWAAQIRINGKMTNLGRFEIEEIAAAAYDAAARKHFGEFARTGENACGTS